MVRRGSVRSPTLLTELFLYAMIKALPNKKSFFGHKKFHKEKEVKNMICELCGKDIGDTIVLLPLKRTNGALSTMACLNCAENSSAYCKKHNRPHLGFMDDNSTACILCIEEIVAQKENEEVFIFDKILEAIPLEEKKRLLDWATAIASIKHEREATSVLRAVVTKALRLKRTVEETVAQVVIQKSIESILSEWVF